MIYVDLDLRHSASSSRVRAVTAVLPRFRRAPRCRTPAARSSTAEAARQQAAHPASGRRLQPVHGRRRRAHSNQRGVPARRRPHDLVHRLRAIPRRELPERCAQLQPRHAPHLRVPVPLKSDRVKRRHRGRARGVSAHAILIPLWFPRAYLRHCLWIQRQQRAQGENTSPGDSEKRTRPSDRRREGERERERERGVAQWRRPAAARNVASSSA